jgi:hypothetical protein
VQTGPACREFDGVLDTGGVRTEILAAYIVSATKDRVEGRGKFTMIVSLHNPVIVDTPGEPSRLVAPKMPKTHVAGGVIQRWEESFRRKWAPRQASLIDEMLEEELEDEMGQ